MQTDGLSLATIEENYKRAKQRRVDALAEYEAANAELEWWRQGLQLFGSDYSNLSDESGSMVTELFPDRSLFTGKMRPTLRQAIVLVMRDNPARRWSVDELASALNEQGWLPERESAKKRVSDMAGDMVRLGQLARVNRGVYALSSELAAGLDAQRVSELPPHDGENQ